ncbi:SpoIIE family protein phosphatase [Streptomyces sp. NPDC026672]|uniref:SpoIIE family protein phosphatase n=1 Tax=unclassified Streptomyces TaxID=2593676 RepID=UPI0033DBC6FD
MDMDSGNAGDQELLPDPTAVVVVDGDGLVTGWNTGATRLLGDGLPALRGHPFAELIAGRSPLPHEPVPAPGQLLLRKLHGGVVDAALTVVPVEGTGTRLLFVAPADEAAEETHGVAVLRAIRAQDLFGLALHDTDLRLVWTNITQKMFGVPPLSAGGRLHESMHPDDAAAVEAVLREVLTTGKPVVARLRRMHAFKDPGHAWALSLSAFRLHDRNGTPSGVVLLIRDATEQEDIRRHRDLLHEAAIRIGFSLDITATAKALAAVVAPGLADLATVDMAEPVLHGDEPLPAPGRGGQDLVRVATASASGTWPAGLMGVGRHYPRLPDSPTLRDIQNGRSIVMDRAAVIESLGGGALADLLVPEDAHSLTVAPLFARGLLLGSVTAWRTEDSAAFGESDAVLLTEIASRAALGIDNARRYVSARRAATALQERLLPSATTSLSAADTAALYRPAGDGIGISGDWFDVVPLPSLRLALVIGDVTGHGLAAAATMGRLRTAIQTYLSLELPPEEVLAHAEDLVQRLIAEAPPDQHDVIGASCLCAVYDPTTGQCVLASAGHPPPVLVGPDGSTHLVDVSPGPLLGVGDVLFESVAVDLPPGSLLAFYTDGLFARDGGDIERGTRRLRDELGAALRAGTPLEDVGARLLGTPGTAPARDDVALLFARTRVVDPANVASWEFAPVAASVAEARAAAAGQLTAWGLDEMAFTTELVVSELMTNAIRYAGGQVGLRLVRGDVLICEVTDPSNTQPRLIRAKETDEGGRGLFIVAQCTTRWGCRYGHRGKTIWTEQPVPASPGGAEPGLARAGT